jgi:hypothetical protein
VPPPFLDEPEVHPEHQFYFRAFCDLGSERMFGMGVGPIPISAARSYADRYELTDREWELFWGIIRDTDSDFLSVVNKKTDPNSKTMTSPSDATGMRSQMERMKERSLRK